MKTNFKLLVFFGMATLTLFFVACTKSTPPTVKIHDAVSTSYTSANVTGEVTDEGTSSVTERGFIYGKQGESKQDTMFCGSGLGEFPTRLTGLEPNTTYNCFAFAKNDGSIGTSGKVTFTTRDNDMPILTTSEVENVGVTTASCGGEVMDDGGAEVTDRGVCWGKNHNPTTNGSHTSSGSGLGEFTCNMTNLSANTIYYVRAYATNSKGTSYGNEVKFTTSDGSVSITLSMTNITATSALCNVNVTNDGGAAVTERGTCWSTSQYPTIADSHVAIGSGTGSFTVPLSGLSPSTTYYVRAYAINVAGTSYSDQVSFPTDNGLPTVTTGNVSNITATSATCTGNVTSDGGFSVTARGFCWSTTQNPTISGNHSNNGNGTGSFNGSLTNLQVNKTYYVRAYATNSQGTSYGNEVHFNTANGLPSVTTTAPTINGTTVTTGGNVTSDGGFAVTARGVCYGPNPNPDLTSPYSHTSNGNGTGNYTSSFQVPNNYIGKYYIRAYATNANGTIYGVQKTVECDDLPAFTFNGHLYKVAPSVEAMQWNEANAYCNNLTYYGYSDWRLPTKDELVQMYVDRNSIGGFEDMEYWSSTIYEGWAAFVVRFTTGLVRYYSMQGAAYVRPIRKVN